MRQQVIDLLTKVQRMRCAQGKYFKTREKVHLIASKQLEMEVDIETAKLLTDLKK